MILSFDPGAKGGICLLDKDKIIKVWNMPSYIVKKTTRNSTYTDVVTIRELLLPYIDKIDYAIIEDVYARKEQGVVSMFSFGHSAGSLHGLMAGLNIPIKLVSPQKWQNKFFTTLKESNLTTKEKSLHMVNKLYPDYDWPKELVISRGPSKGNLKDGVTDAILIGLYGYKYL